MTLLPTASATPAASPKKRGAKNAYPLRNPRFWHGMTWGAWMSLLMKHRFRIHPTRWPMALAITGITPFNSMMGTLQSFWYGNRIARQTIDQPPVFIVGHWRSGTTFLHELMSLDDRFGSPTTYQCFAPRHFLLTEWLIANYMGFLMPKKRPMDNMAAGWHRPQEDEFALLTLNAPTPYFRMAFPNEPAPYLEFLDMQGISPTDATRFREAMLSFVKLITFRYGKQLLLKSPPHTGRIEMLSELSPGAKFIHITRDPYAVFASTRKLWESLDDVQGLQRPRHADLDAYIFAAFERMYRGFEQQRARLPADAVHDLRYEDLIARPVEELQNVYERLQFTHFETIREKVNLYTAGQKDYQTNRHDLEPAVKAEIRRRWSGYFDRYGYSG